MLCEELHVTQYKCDEAEEYFHLTVSTRYRLSEGWAAMGGCLLPSPSADRLDSHKRSHLVGDFNVDVCLDLSGLVYIPLALLTQLVNVPTRLLSTSASAIDHA